MGNETKTYVGKCHCGAVRFRFTSKPIVSAMRCNCSLCRRRNAIMSMDYFTPDRFELLSGQDVLAVYRFAPYKVNHYFCRRCGIYPFHSPVETPEMGYRVNLGCVDDLIDPGALPVRLFDGRDTWEFLD